MESVCPVCLKVVGGAHKCNRCGLVVHLICGKPVGEEGYGQKVTCFNCLKPGQSGRHTGGDEHSKEAQEESQRSKGNEDSVRKRQTMWDWKGASRMQDTVPEKKQKLATQSTKKLEKFVCLQCLELSLQGSRDERFTTLCRVDTSSLLRHTNRWHDEDGNRVCNVVPSNSKEVQTLREKYLNAEKDAKSKHVSQEEPKSSPVDDGHEDAAGNKASNSPANTDTALDHSQSTKVDIKHQQTLLHLSQYDRSEEKEEPINEVNLSQIMSALNNLTLKVDNLNQQHKSFAQLSLDEGVDRDTLSGLKMSNNILQLVSASKEFEWFYDETTEHAVLRCLPCFNLQLAAKPNLANLSPFRAQQLLNRSSNGTLSTGIFLNKESSRNMIKGHNQVWYRYKSICLHHLFLIGEGSKTHQMAMKEHKRVKAIREKRLTAASNIFRAAIVDVKLGAAGQHFETLVSFLACCSVEVGQVGHGRNNFNDIIYCLETTIDKKVKAWLNTPLPSTLLPPHFWATVDKATPSRTTNQAVLIVARDENGVPCPIPVDAPKVYTDFTAASYDQLAEQLLQVLADHFSEDILERLCGVAADGPYQTEGFGQKLRDHLKIEDEVDLALPVTWDPAHILNLAVTDVRDAKNESGAFLRKFIKRCNVFNHILSNGKGFAFLEMTDPTARRPVSYATARFASSSYEQWVKIASSYGSFWKAFELLHPNRSADEEWQYMIGGSDFVEDLLAVLDIVEPVVEMMVRVQKLHTPIWKLSLWWPKVKKKLMRAASGLPEAFPRLEDAKPSLKPGGLYKGVHLLEGWLIMKEEIGENNRFTWQMRESQEIKEDRERFARDLMESLESRIDSAINENVIPVLEVFDATSLVSLQCGLIDKDGINYTLGEAEVEAYGVDACKEILKVAAKMPHVLSSGINFDERMGYKYMSKIKESVKEAVWSKLCPEWFVSLDGEKAINVKADLVEFHREDSLNLDSIYRMVFSDGSSKKVRLIEHRFYESFYNNKKFYGMVEPPSCALLDIVLSKGGPEAIAESFYNAMRNQQQSGGQSNETLARRTKVNWCLPSLRKCDEIIKEAVALYIAGDSKLPAHRRTMFFSSSRAKQYNVSKVVDRVDDEEGHCPFLSRKH